ncbi:MAG: lipocalin family protein [Terriglobales bacterium]
MSLREFGARYHWVTCHRIDYWVIGLSPDYQYAIVGEPSRKYLWILSRTPSMEEATYQEVLILVETLGYQPGKLQKTNQSVQANVPSPS